jgi:tetratricopeptide (TPR) repeat protein
MFSSSLHSATNRRLLILAGLLVVAIAAFLAVGRLVRRYGEQQKALARRMFAQGNSEQAAGEPEHALEDYRAALQYDRTNFTYQLSLARALRDSGRTAEARDYLLTLWENNPQDGAINLALGRLAVREGSVENAVHYYHNAVYGIWPEDADKHRFDAEFELVDFLLKEGAIPQAQAELISLEASHPTDLDTRLRIADLFARSHDSEHALASYQEVLRRDRNDINALNGAGQAALALGRYRIAQNYLRAAAELDPNDLAASSSLQLSTMILQSDPMASHISAGERRERINSALAQASARLASCAQARAGDLQSGNVNHASDGMQVLQSRLDLMKNDMKRSNAKSDEDTASSALDLVGEIERQTAQLCGAPVAMDAALLRISADRAASESESGK